MEQRDFLRVAVAGLDFFGAAVFGLAVGLVFVADGNMEEDLLSGAMILIATALAGFAALGVVLAVVVGCKRSSRAWLLWNIAYLVSVELPLAALAFLDVSVEVLKVGFLLLVLPVLGCVACWRLILEEKRQGREGLREVFVDESSEA